MEIAQMFNVILSSDSLKRGRWIIDIQWRRSGFAISTVQRVLYKYNK